MCLKAAEEDENTKNIKPEKFAENLSTQLPNQENKTKPRVFFFFGRGGD